VDEWLSNETSKESSRADFCFSIDKIKEIISHGIIEVPALKDVKIQFPFVLSGKTDQLWSQVTNNQWNKMLSKHWIDKGFQSTIASKKEGLKQALTLLLIWSLQFVVEK
jgi:hypothetical protein